MRTSICGAWDSGALPPQRLASYQKLQGEAELGDSRARASLTRMFGGKKPMKHGHREEEVAIHGRASGTVGPELARCGRGLMQPLVTVHALIGFLQELG